MKNNKIVKSSNLAMLSFFAENLGELCNEVVFLGGCTTSLFITDAHAPDARYTYDVDCIADVISLNHYYKFGDALKNKGFTQSIHDEVICRWRINDMILDVMPMDETILGFGNRWYKAAVEHAQKIKVKDNCYINVVSAPYFLATKLEAFHNRGKLDFLGSHDMEDIISVIDGREEIVSDIEQSDEIIQTYLSQQFGLLLNNLYFRDALAGHLNYGAILEERISVVTERIEKICKVVVV